MSWRPNGRYYRFSPEVIRACVPTSSGVYGLFNFSYQLLIGESDNLRDALLRHLGEGERTPRRYRPSRFTFQLCPAAERKRKAAALIEEFQPVRQIVVAPGELLSSSAGAPSSDLRPGALEQGRIDLEEFSMHERESAPSAQPRYYFERAQGVKLLALFTVAMTASFYLGMLAGEKFPRQANRQSENKLAWTSTPMAPTEYVTVDPLEPNGATLGPDDNLSVDIPGWKPANRDPAMSAAPDKTTPQPAPGNAPAQQAGTTLARNSTVTPTNSHREPGDKWSVQIAAAPTQDVADALAKGLNSAGFESYVVQALVKGQTFYRVRIGPMEAQDKAESVRQTLARQERFRDAFVVNE
jgi:cell division septation protein DedD